MASERTVVATRVGGPPEFVRPGSGILVDPLDIDDLTRALGRAVALGTPNPTARAAAADHDVHHQVERIEMILMQAYKSRNTAPQAAL
jgi:glycosyltransferase involved in cell wall biosynthesis